jgi:hypothetical protein
VKTGEYFRTAKGTGGRNGGRPLLFSYFWACIKFLIKLLQLDPLSTLTLKKDTHVNE